MNASRSLKEAADIISENSQALQLRYLQTLTTISAEKSSTILFPLPLSFLSRLLPKDGKAVFVLSLIFSMSIPLIVYISCSSSKGNVMMMMMMMVVVLVGGGGGGDGDGDGRGDNDDDNNVVYG